MPNPVFSEKKNKKNILEFYKRKKLNSLPLCVLIVRPEKSSRDRVGYFKILVFPFHDVGGLAICTNAITDHQLILFFFFHPKLPQQISSETFSNNSVLIMQINAKHSG